MTRAMNDGTRPRRPWLDELWAYTLLLSLLAFAWTFAEVSVPNERTRAYLSAAIVDDGSVAIDGPIARYGRVYDLATRDGHLYSDKAPGSSLLGAPVYGVARRIQPAVSTDSVRMLNVFRTWLMLPLGLLSFACMRQLLRAFRRSAFAVELGSFGLVVCTPMFHYATAMYGHVVVVAFWLLALCALKRAGMLDDAPEAAPAHLGALALAGAAAGMVGLTEYQAVPLSALLALPVLTTRHPARFQRLFVFALGAAPFAAALLMYNKTAFGGPFELSYQHLSGSALSELHGRGFLGATYPTSEALFGLTLSWARGILPTAPLAALGAVALVRMRTTLGSRLHSVICLSVLYLFLIVASSNVWHGAWSAGPRLLVPAMPALVLAAALWADDGATSRLATLARAAAFYGFLFHFLLQLTFAELPQHLARPLPESVVPMLRAQLFAPNLACKVWGNTLWTLLPAAALALALAYRLGSVGVASRARWRTLGLSVGTALLAFAVSCAMPTASSEKDRRDWFGLMEIFAHRETACAK